MKNTITIIILLFSLFMTGCEKILTDFKFADKEPKIVVQAKITPDSISRVFITRSVDMHDKREIKKLSSAIVNLYMNEENLALLNQDSAGWYSIPKGLITEGESYTLEIESDGYPRTSAGFYVPIVPEIKSIDTSTVHNISSPYSFGYNIRGKCTVHFADNPETDDYYTVSIRVKNMMINYDEYWEPVDTVYYQDYGYISSQSPYLEIVYHEQAGYMKQQKDIWGGYTKLIFSDKLFNGSSNASIDFLILPEYSIHQGPIAGEEQDIEVIFSSVDQQYYKYAYTKAEMYQAEGNPLAEPVTPFSPVINGFGLVYGVSSRSEQVNITGLLNSMWY